MSVRRTESARRDVEVCVVGAGPHGLAVVIHLLAARPSLRDRIVVVDPNGRWLHTWQEQFARLEIDVLRSPIVHHPDVGAGALAQFVTDRALARSQLPYDPPLVSVFDSFCSDLVAELELDAVIAAARVDQLVVDDGFTITTTNGESIRARRVVWTGNTAVPIVPPPLASEIGASPLRHSAHVDLRVIGSLDGEHVVIVGGGLTAAHLAVGAIERSARVTLVTRRPIVERDFDVEPGWLGPRYLDGYERLRSPHHRLATARSARGGGSMPRWMCRRLDSEMRAGRLDHVVGTIESGSFDDDGGQVRVGGRPLGVDRCWLATGTRPDMRADRALAPHVEHHVDGIPVVRKDLRAGRRPLHLTGRLATTELGPAAGNLWGARVAARRITLALTGVDLDTDAVAAIRPPTPSRQKGNR